MGTVTYNGKTYVLDGKNYLSDFFHWDENFAEWMAQELKTPDPLTKEHWDVLHSIRSCFSEHGKCPTVYETCRLNGLGLDGLMKLFPHGYLRGACPGKAISIRIICQARLRIMMLLPLTKSIMWMCADF